MKSKRSRFVALVLFLMLTPSFFASTTSQTITQNLTVTLNSPANGSTLTSFECNFTYTPTLLGNNSLLGAQLIMNGTEMIYQPYPQNSTTNRIAGIFSANGTYVWNIRIQDNATNVVMASANFTVTVAVPPAPTSTPIASPAPTSTSTPTPTSTSTPVPTMTQAPTPSSSPTLKPAEQPIAIDGWSIVIIALIVLAIIFALIIGSLVNRIRTRN